MDRKHSTSPDSSKRRQSSAQAMAGADDPVQTALDGVNCCDSYLQQSHSVTPCAAELAGNTVHIKCNMTSKMPGGYFADTIGCRMKEFTWVVPQKTNTVW